MSKTTKQIVEMNNIENSENTPISTGTVKKISVEDYNKQLSNFKSQNEIMKLGELRAQCQHEKDKISQIVNTELDQDEITQQNILDFLDNFSTTKNKESKLLGLLFRINVICKDFKKAKEIIYQLNEQLESVRKDLQLEKNEKVVKIPDNLKCKMCNENKYQDLHFNFFDEKICKTCCINNDEFRLLTKNEIMELHNTTFSKNKINIILKDLMYKPEPNPFNPRFSQIKVYLLKHFVEASNLHNKNSTNKTSNNDMDKDLNNNTIKLSTNNPKVNSDKKNKIDYREIYNKYFIEDLTIGEIAKRVNRQNSTVESYLVKAHKNGMPYKDKQLNKLGISPELITEIKNFILLWKSKNTTQELPKLKLIKDNINTKVSYLSIKIVLEFI